MCKSLPQVRGRMPQDERRLKKTTLGMNEGVRMNHTLNYTKIGGAALVALAAALLQPLAQAQPAPATGASTMPGMSSSSPMAGDMDMKALMKDMSDKMSSMPMTGNQDVDFAKMMRLHHQGAIDMAEPELRSGKAPEMQKLAKDIIAAQKKEITLIDKFLAKQAASSKAMPSK